MRIFSIHLQNEYSGSPKVLMQLVKGWVNKGYEVTVVTAAAREGFLSGIENARYLNYWYKQHSNPFIGFINLMVSQLILMFKLLFAVRNDDIIYVNTVMPFGAALIGRLKNCRVIYHMHETTSNPLPLKEFLFSVVKWTADDVVYVSKHLSESDFINTAHRYVLHNALEDEFLYEALITKREKRTYKHVLMVSALKESKGVNEFVALAKLNPLLSFRLVANASTADIDRFFSAQVLPSNLTVYPTQTNIHPFYLWADVVLNLSRPDKWIETSGLSILEAMAYKLPVIIPPVGGITELVEENINGFLVDSRNIKLLSRTLNKLLENGMLYERIRSNALQRIKLFTDREFISKSVDILTEKFDPEKGRKFLAFSGTSVRPFFS